MSNDVWLCLLILGISMGTIFGNAVKFAQSLLVVTCSFFASMAWFALAVWAGGHISWLT